MTSDLYYVLVPNRGYQEADTLADARAMAKGREKAQNAAEAYRKV